MIGKNAGLASLGGYGPPEKRNPGVTFGVTPPDHRGILRKPYVLSSEMGAVLIGKNAGVTPTRAQSLYFSNQNGRNPRTPFLRF